MDITKRAATERYRRDDVALLSAITESASDGLPAAGDDGQVLPTSQRFVEPRNLPPELVALGDDNRLLATTMGQLVEPEVVLDRPRPDGHRRRGPR